MRECAGVWQPKDVVKLFPVVLEPLGTVLAEPLERRVKAQLARMDSVLDRLHIERERLAAEVDRAIGELEEELDRGSSRRRIRVWRPLHRQVLGLGHLARR
jgi:hypothetical protein